MSNRYRLIKEYPGSPNLGSIKDSKNYIPAMEHMKDYPEFWELVVEKDYEILSLIHKEQKTRILLAKDANIDVFLECKASDNYWDIHSVKRNDGEIFTIGDKVNNGIIKSIFIPFEFGTTTVCIQCDNKKGIYLQECEKVKQKLFTSEDGVDIFEGDNLYSIDNMLNIKKHLLFNARYDDNTLLNNRIFFNSDYKHFSTKEKAEEYILYNKPVLSLKEIKETTTIKGLSLKKLEKLVQQKLKS